MLVHQTMIDDCMSYYLNIISICHCARRISIIMFAAHHFRCGRFYDTISIAVAVTFMPPTPKSAFEQANRKSANLIQSTAIEWRNPIKQNHNCFRNILSVRVLLLFSPETHRNLQLIQ